MLPNCILAYTWVMKGFLVSICPSIGFILFILFVFLCFLFLCCLKVARILCHFCQSFLVTMHLMFFSLMSLVNPAQYPITSCQLLTAFEALKYMKILWVEPDLQRSLKFKFYSMIIIRERKSILPSIVFILIYFSHSWKYCYLSVFYLIILSCFL